MFKLSLAIAASASRRAGARALHPAQLRPAVHPASALRFARFESTKAPDFWTAPELSYEEVKKRSDQPTPNNYIIDVREPDEVALGMIPSAVNIPLSNLANSLTLNPVAFKEKFGFEKPQKKQEIVMYCRSGKRSASSADIAMKHGYTNVHNYEGSWLDWTAKEQKR